MAVYILLSLDSSANQYELFFDLEAVILLHYVDAKGKPTPAANPNGSLENIAGVCNEARNVFGLMPHPEDACNRLLGSDDGAKLFASIAAAVADGVKRRG